jgi:hypothetical protein
MKDSFLPASRIPFSCFNCVHFRPDGISAHSFHCRTLCEAETVARVKSVPLPSCSFPECYWSADHALLVTPQARTFSLPPGIFITRIQISPNNSTHQRNLISFHKAERNLTANSMADEEIILFDIPSIPPCKGWSYNTWKSKMPAVQSLAYLSQH